jgi:AmmeMemoRadiSam system protein B
MSDSIIKLRWPLDIRVDTYNGREIIVIQCPHGITERALILDRNVAPLLSAIGAGTTRVQLAERFIPMGASDQLIDELIALLDARCFLDNARYLESAQAHKDRFLALKVRPSTLAGVCYAQDPQELTEYLEHTLGQEPQNIEGSLQNIVGLMAPHIDYQRGVSGYAAAYRELVASSPDLIILIGTSHQYSERLFQLTTKSFDTPLGVLTTDTHFVQQLSLSYGLDRSFSDEYLHKREHSLELQTPYLKHLAPSAQIVPILVGGFHRYLQAERRTPGEDEEYQTFIGALSEQVRIATQLNRNVVVVAGVDMAHVGPQFGDKELTPQMMEIVAERDQRYLTLLTERNPEALFAYIAEDGDRRRVCGFPTMYTVLDLFNRLDWQLTPHVCGYHQAVDYERGCAVTFGALSYRSTNGVVRHG